MAKTLVMYDSIELSQIPASAPAVAGYVGGRWPTYRALLEHFPRAHHLSIAIAASQDADCLDIEAGDATPAQAPAWVLRQLARGVWRPCVYANASTMPAVLAALARAGIRRRDVRVWVAHYTYREHLEPGSDATQWHNRALGRNLDVSVCRADFFARGDYARRLAKWRAELRHRRAQLRVARAHGTRHYLRRRIHELRAAIRKHR